MCEKNVNPKDGKLRDVLLETPSTDAGALHSLLNGFSASYKQFCTVRAAVQTGLFDALEQPKNIAVLASELETDPAMTEDLCQILRNLGLLKKNGVEYENSPMANIYLRSGSPLFQGEVIRDIKNGFQLWDRLDHILKNGAMKVSEEAFFENNLVYSLAAEIMCGELQHTVDIVSQAPGFRKDGKLLDLGGGHGLYSVALCEKNEGLEASVFDFPDIVREAEPLFNTYGSEKVTFTPGNLFTDDFGEGYDTVFFSYNPGGKNPHILEKICRALKPGGLFVTKHAFYREDEGSKSRLLDLEWKLSAFDGVGKEKNVYHFSGDLHFEDYLDLMRKDFSIIDIVDAEAFASHPLTKFGDRLDSKMILARKRE